MRRSGWWAIAVVAAAAFVACSDGSMAYTQPSTAALRPGIWAADQAVLQVTAGEPAVLDLPCAHGTIPGPLTIQGDGRVEWPGRFVRERGGPAREGEAEGNPATYRGTVSGDTLTLDVLVAGRDAVGRMTFTYGRRVRITKCQ